MILAPLTIALSLVGWSDVAVAPARADRPISSFGRSLAGLDRPSERTAETLRRFGLDAKFRRDPAAAVGTLEGQVRGHPDPDLVYALAELSWIESKRLERRRSVRKVPFSPRRVSIW